MWVRSPLRAPRTAWCDAAQRSLQARGATAPRSNMAWFPQQALNDGVRKREVFGWAMYDFANSGYTTVVITAVFAAYFVSGIAQKAEWATFAWTLALSIS